jgi:hypothetical protein
MAAIDHFGTPGIPDKMRAREVILPWLKDTAAALGLVAFIASCFVLADVLQGPFS